MQKLIICADDEHTEPLAEITRDASDDPILAFAPSATGEAKALLEQAFADLSARKTLRLTEESFAEGDEDTLVMDEVEVDQDDPRYLFAMAEELSITHGFFCKVDPEWEEGGEDWD